MQMIINNSKLLTRCKCLEIEPRSKVFLPPRIGLSVVLKILKPKKREARKTPTGNIILLNHLLGSRDFCRGEPKLTTE